MASFNYTKVDPDRLGTSARNIEDSIKTAEKALSDIEEAIQSSLKPSLSGEGSDAFFSKCVTDSQNFSEFFTKLRIQNELLIQAAAIYAKADNEANGIVNSLSVS